MKSPEEDEDDEPHLTASSSNDPTFRLPTTTPHSFSRLWLRRTRFRQQDTIPYQDPGDEMEEPVMNEQEIEHLQSTQPYDSEFVQFEGDYLLFFLDIYRQLPISNPVISLASNSFANPLQRMERKLRSLNLSVCRKFYKSMPGRSNKPSLNKFVVS